MGCAACLLGEERGVWLFIRSKGKGCLYKAERI